MSFRQGTSVLNSSMDQPRIFEMILQIENTRWTVPNTGNYYKTKKNDIVKTMSLHIST
jgi:hypothetical protein